MVITDPGRPVTWALLSVKVFVLYVPEVGVRVIGKAGLAHFTATLKLTTMFVVVATPVAPWLGL